MRYTICGCHGPYNPPPTTTVNSVALFLPVYLSAALFRIASRGYQASQCTPRAPLSLKRGHCNNCLRINHRCDDISPTTACPPRHILCISLSASTTAFWKPFVEVCGLENLLSMPNLIPSGPARSGNKPPLSSRSDKNNVRLTIDSVAILVARSKPSTSEQMPGTQSARA